MVRLTTLLDFATTLTDTTLANFAMIFALAIARHGLPLSAMTSRPCLATISGVAVTAVCDQTDQVIPARRVACIDESSSVETVHQAYHKDEHNFV